MALGHFRIFASTCAGGLHSVVCTALFLALLHFVLLLCCGDIESNPGPDMDGPHDLFRRDQLKLSSIGIVKEAMPDSSNYLHSLKSTTYIQPSSLKLVAPTAPRLMHSLLPEVGTRFTFPHTLIRLIRLNFHHNMLASEGSV
jgi:hypothetical protein